jgi:hypothetical protein
MAYRSRKHVSELNRAHEPVTAAVELEALATLLRCWKIGGA